jgi:hypothetical protein
VQRQPVIQVELMAHLERAYKHVNLAAVRLVVKKHPAPGLNAVKALVSCVPEPFQAGLEPLLLASLNRQVNVGIETLKRCGHCGMAVLGDAKPADQARGNAVRAQRRDHLVGSFLDAGKGLAVDGDAGHGCAPGPRLAWPAEAVVESGHRVEVRSHPLGSQAAVLVADGFVQSLVVLEFPVLVSLDLVELGAAFLQDQPA